MRRAILPALVFCSIIASTNLHAQNSSALINEQLDKIANLNLNTVLPQAMQQISRDYGVRIEANPAVWELLPWGEQTNIIAKIENSTLRSALDAIARKLGLTYVLKEDVVELQPAPALARLGRRATVQELRALDMLASSPLPLNTPRPTLRQLLAAVDAKQLGIDKAHSPPLGFAIEDRFDGSDEQHVAVPRNATMMAALEAIPQQTGATWYPWGASILVVSKEDQVRNLLSKPVTIHYSGVDVSQVLAELSQRSRADFTYEPGAIQRIPGQFRNINLTIDSAPIQQVLEHLSGFTGLGYVVNDDGVYIFNQAHGQGAAARDPVVALLPLDNGMELMLTESKVPPDVREYLEQKRERFIDAVREMMREEGFVPSTQPEPTNAPNPDL